MNLDIDIAIDIDTDINIDHRHRYRDMYGYNGYGYGYRCGWAPEADGGFYEWAGPALGYLDEGSHCFGSISGASDFWKLPG